MTREDARVRSRPPTLRRTEHKGAQKDESSSPLLPDSYVSLFVD